MKDPPDMVINQSIQKNIICHRTPKGKENAGFMKMVSAERVLRVYSVPFHIPKPCAPPSGTMESVLKVINALKDTLLRYASNT